jgi:hypothetical protein
MLWTYYELQSIWIPIVWELAYILIHFTNSYIHIFALWIHIHYFVLQNSRCFEFKVWFLWNQPKAAHTPTTSSGSATTSRQRFTQMGVYSLASSERGVTLTQEEFPAVNASVAGNSPWHCRRFWRWAATVEHIWLLACSKPTSCAQVSKRLVAYIKTFIVLSPYGKTSDSRFAAIADAHFQTALTNLGILTDVDIKDTHGTQGWRVLHSLWLRRTREIWRAALLLQRRAAEAAAAVEAVEAQAASASSNTPRYSLDGRMLIEECNEYTGPYK